MRYAAVLEAMPKSARTATARPQPRPADDHPLLHLQRSAGNAAVQRLVRAGGAGAQCLLRPGHGLAGPGAGARGSAGPGFAGPGFAVQRETEREAARERRFADAVGTGDWPTVVDVLAHADDKWMVDRLRGLSPGQLRYVSDAVRRAGANSTLLGRMVQAGMTQHAIEAGQDADTGLPAASYGVIEGHAAKITDGKLGPGGNNQSASYRFEITFTPNTKVAQSTLIEFIQVARVVSTVNVAPDPVGVPVGQNAGVNGPRRQTADHSRVDRVTGSNIGWYGAPNAGQPNPSHMRPWTPGSKQPAFMEDTPNRSGPNVDFSFETAAISRTGPDAGTVYATITWGFTIDANMKIVPKEPAYFNKESQQFDLAVTFWNVESARTGSTQQPLPANLH